MQDHLVIADAKLTEARGQSPDRALQVTIIKRRQPPAHVADQMMVVIATRIDDLIASQSLPEVQAIDQSTAVQQLKDSIDAGPADLPRRVTQAILDFDRRQRTGLTGQHVDDSGSCRSPPMTGSIEL